MEMGVERKMKVKRGRGREGEEGRGRKGGIGRSGNFYPIKS